MRDMSSRRQVKTALTQMSCCKMEMADLAERREHPGEAADNLTDSLLAGTAAAANRRVGPQVYHHRVLHALVKTQAAEVQEAARQVNLWVNYAFVVVARRRCHVFHYYVCILRCWAAESCPRVRPTALSIRLVGGRG